MRARLQIAQASELCRFAVVNSHDTGRRRAPKGGKGRL
jgi:hypothetical protein